MPNRQSLQYLISSMKQSLNKIRYGKRYQLSLRTRIERRALIRIDNHGSIRMGDYTIVRSGTEIHADGGTITFEGNSFVNRNCCIISHEAIFIGKDSTIGPNTVIYDHDHDFKGDGKYVSRSVSIGRNVWIGAGCIILKGSTIGDHSVIAAGTLVSGDVPANSIYMNRREGRTISIDR